MARDPFESYAVPPLSHSGASLPLAVRVAARKPVLTADPCRAPISR